MNSTEPTNKLCEHCHQSDFTDFSTCRYCGKKYGTAPPPPPKTYLTEKALAVSAAALGMIGIVHHERAKSEAERNTTLAGLQRTISVNHRPRVLEFGAKWCGACQAYGPIIEAAQTKYPNIDFVRYNIDDDSAEELTSGLGVRAIPVTCFFDSDGKLIDQEVGCLPPEMLDEHLKAIL
ncbi:MAG: thioredoxin family protein [Cyanobacteria bacterium SZAS-4]|nr:thioredoxin family protein [Cyanobacteria bacterium SZAS-4]